MHNIELQFEVCFTAKSLGFNADFRILFYKQVSLPFLLVQGQIYALDPDPLISEEENEGYDYTVVESGFYECEGTPTAFIKLRDVSTFEESLGSTTGITVSEMKSLYTEWKSHVENEIKNLSENFLRLGWHTAD